MKSFPSAITWHLAERDTLPDADTDVLVYVEDEPEAQLGALTGENADGSLAWVGAQGEPLERVKRWAPMPAPGKPDALTLRLLAADKLYEEAEQLLRLTSLFRCDYQANADLARALQQYDQARSAA